MSVRGVVSVALGIWLLFARAATSLETRFTYQGQVKQAGTPLNNTADFEFRLFSAPFAGLQAGSTIPVSGVNLVNGLFTVSLDFGSSPFNGDPRWLEIAVRSPAGGGNFTVLTPRQPLTATPFALYALNGPGGAGPWAVDGNNAFTTNTGNVGIGTHAPGKKLTIAGDAELGVHSGDYRHLRIGGGNSDGFLYGSFPRLGDGLHFGYNYYADAQGDNQIIRSDGGTSRITAGYGFVAIATQAPFAGEPVDRVVVESNGDVRLGTNASLYAVAGEENLRTVRGIVGSSGDIIAGSGFGVVRWSEGRYTVLFNPPFTGKPTLTASIEFMLSESTAWDVRLRSSDADSAEFWTLGDGFTDGQFHFVAVGPR